MTPRGTYLSGAGADNVQSKPSDTVDAVSGNVQPKGLTHFRGLRGRAGSGRLPLCARSLQMLPRRAAGCGDSWTAVPIDAATEACHGDGGGGGGGGGGWGGIVLYV